MGDKVIKFAYPQHIHTSLSLDDIETMPYANGKIMRIIPKLELTDITNEDAQYVYNQLRKEGVVWSDAHEGNLGRVSGTGKEKSGLRLIDDGYLYLEKDLDGSVFDFLARTRADMLIREVNYQIHLNPNFKLRDIKKLMKHAIKSDIDYNDSIISKYKLHERKTPITHAEFVIKAMKCIEWNKIHEKDGITKRYIPGAYLPLYTVYDENDEFKYATKYNPLLVRPIKKVQDRLSRIFSKKKILELGEHVEDEHIETSDENKENFRERIECVPKTDKFHKQSYEYQGRTVDINKENLDR